MFGLSLTELLVILAIVLLLFGTRRLRGLGGDLGNAIKGFRQAMRDEDDGKASEQGEEQHDYIEGEIKQDAEDATSTRPREHAGSGDRKP